MIKIEPKIRLDRLKAAAAKLRANRQSGAVDGVLGDMHKQWAARYFAFVQRRYREQSRGAGEWPALKPATIARRRLSGSTDTIGGARRRTMASLRGAQSAASATRKVRRLKRIAKAAGKERILINTGSLANAVIIGQPGNRIARIPGGVELGIVGGKAAGKSKMTLGRLARIHHDGNAAKGLPSRKIIVQPDEQTRKGMIADADRALKKLLKGGA